MTELIKKYENIMELYKSGSFGTKHLSLNEVLERAGEPDLFDRMSCDEIEYLIDNSCGITKLLFIELKKKKIQSQNLETQTFDVLAVPYRRQFVVDPEKANEFNSKKTDYKKRKQMYDFVSKFDINNLDNPESVINKVKKIEPKKL